MQTVQQQLQTRVHAALAAALGEADTTSLAPEALHVVPCAHAEFGDYQFNGSLPLAKLQRANPRALAQTIVGHLDVTDISETPEIAGPGFINFRLRREFVEQMTAQVLADARLGVPAVAESRRIVVDFSAPNVAKPMHVGHIRSTIIGDAVAHLLRFVGHHVITDNHIGDWGTQFGKLLVGWKKHRDEENLQRDPIGEMERLYRLVNALSESDPAVADEARSEIAKLQAGDAENLQLWTQMRELSEVEFKSIYERLGIQFDATLGESFYNDRLESVVQTLQKHGIAEESEGAVVVKFKDVPQLAERPMLIRKSDGASLYATTDLATIAYRKERWNVDEIIYVVDSRQSLHFQQLFEAARLWGYGDIEFRHVAFGTILGEDGRPIKTRSGEPIKLRDLLDEAERRALDVVREKNPDLTADQQQEVARVVGLGAIKYADLSQNRTSDYVFSWDKLLAMQGNTAPYLQYAYVRIRAIFRRAQEQGLATADAGLDRLVLEQDAELNLAKFLLRFDLAIQTALGDFRLNALTDYLFELAQTFSGFYDACPVVKSEEPLRSSRLALCRLTADVLKLGLSLLGIQTIEHM